MVKGGAGCLLIEDALNIMPCGQKSYKRMLQTNVEQGISNVEYRSFLLRHSKFLVRYSAVQKTSY